MDVVELTDIGGRALDARLSWAEFEASVRWLRLRVGECCWRVLVRVPC